MRLPDATALYLGQDPAIEAYLGDVLVWPFPFYTGCTPEGGVMSVSGMVEGGSYVIYGCGYEAVFDSAGNHLLSGDTCEASITGDTISITGATDPIVFTAKLVGADMFRFTTEVSGDTYYLWASVLSGGSYGVTIFISNDESAKLVTSTLFTLNEGRIQPVSYSGYDLFMYNYFGSLTMVFAQEPEWVYRNVDMKNGFKAWMRLYNIANHPAPITGYTFVNSIFTTGSYANNRIYLPFDTFADMEIFFDGQLLANVGGTAFGGYSTNDNNDYRFFCTNMAYFDIGSARIRTNASRANIRKVHTWNYGFEITYEDSTVVTATGTYATVPSLPAVINIGYLKIKSYKVMNGNTVVFDGVPAVRDSDGYIGLYDYVTNQFYLPESQTNISYD